jgi:hypothetical protein
MSAPKPAWAAHDDDGVWYCDAHGTYDCRRCAVGPSAPGPSAPGPKPGPPPALEGQS